jgi:hypothetical protein
MAQICSLEYVAVIEPIGIAQKTFKELTDVTGPSVLLGSILSTSGAVYNPFDVAIEDATGQFAGGVQPFIDPNSIPLGQLDGQCVATSVDEAKNLILAHSCYYNLCTSTDNCINYYAGSPFEYEPMNAANTLPPSYPGSIIGGTGTFSGIEGSVEVITVAGRSLNGQGSIAQRIYFLTNLEF